MLPQKFMFAGLNIVSHGYLAWSDQKFYVRGQGCLVSIKALSNLSAYSQIIVYNGHSTRVVESVL